MGDSFGFHYESSPPPPNWHSALDELDEPIVPYAAPGTSWDYTVCPLPSPKKEINKHPHVEDIIRTRLCVVEYLI